MKKLALILACIAFVGCDKNCDEEIQNLTEQYKKNLSYTGDSAAAMKKMTDEYYKRLAEINNRCH